MSPYFLCKLFRHIISFLLLQPSTDPGVRPCPNFRGLHSRSHSFTRSRPSILFWLFCTSIMHFSTLFTALIAVLGSQALPTTEVSSSSKYTPASTFSTDLLAAQALIGKGINSFKNGWSDNAQCSPTNVAIRREWYVCQTSSWERLLTHNQVFPFAKGAQVLH